MHRFNTIFFKLLLATVTILIIFSFVLYQTFNKRAEQLILEQVENNALSNLLFAKDKLERYNIEVTNAMLKISVSQAIKDYITKQPKTPLEDINLVINFTDYLNLYRDYLAPENSHIIVSSLPNSGGRYYTSNAIKWDRLPNNIVSEYMTYEGQIVNRILYHVGNPLFKDTSPYKNSVFATKPLIDIETNNIYGYAALVIDERNLYNMYSGYILKGTSIIIINAHAEILSSNHTDKIAKKETTLLQYAIKTAKKETHIIRDNHLKKSYLSVYLPLFDAYLFEQIDHSTAFSTLYEAKQDIFKFMTFILICLSVLIFIISRQVTRPLYDIVGAMRKTSGNDPQQLPSIKSNSTEMKTLTTTYNALISELDDYVKRLIKEKEQCMRADLAALQMQINPHFLYNTLSTIKYLSHNGHSAQVEKTIHSLIQMLKSTLSDSDTTITIERELDLLKHYTYINQVRFGENIKVELSVDDDCLHLAVPKLIIQPFVENAFFHAFNEKSSGTITIFIHKANILTIEIIDNGSGMTQQTYSEVYNKRHFNGIGIQNVNERIKMMYGDSYGIEIITEFNFGTDVKIKLPVITLK